MEKIDSLFISDVHLGSKGSNADYLRKVLKDYKFKKLFIVGDFIDGWLLKKRHHWPDNHTKVLKKILSLSKKGTEINYITGNHDDFLREYGTLNFGNIHITEESFYKGFFITHGDLYDPIVKYGKFISVLGAWGYEVVISINKINNRMRFFLGMKPSSFSKFIKDSVKKAAKYIGHFEETLTEAAVKKGCTGVICGHIHTPQDKMIGEIRYLNCGDWIENNSYIIEKDGIFEIRYFVND